MRGLSFHIRPVHKKMYLLLSQTILVSSRFLQSQILMMIGRYTEFVMMNGVSIRFIQEHKLCVKFKNL